MFPLTVILNRLPFTPAALPAFIANIGASDFHTPPLPLLLIRLVGKRVRFSQRRCMDLLGYRKLSLSGSKRLTIPGGDNRLTLMSVTLLLAGVSKPSALSEGVFGTQYLHGRHYPLPLFLACFRTYASSNLLPSCLQGSILGLWLAVTEAGFTPARICDIAQPQPTEPYFQWLC
jgi:hypothetical protein